MLFTPLETMNLFKPILYEMAARNLELIGPIHFQRYIEQHSISHAKTCQYISVDSIESLSPELRDAGIMVFRLGSRPGSQGTHFGLSKYTNGWDDFFVHDKKLILQARQEDFSPTVPLRNLLAFQLLPKITETSFVNLAVGSGLLQYALGIKDSNYQVVPATGQSTFTFKIKPKPVSSPPWEHINGQVEIDALFIGRRNGKDCLFVVEAKSGPPTGNLAKHKLCYPLAALRSKVPSDIEIIPIYLKTWSEEDGFHFLVAECTASKSSVIIISELATRSVHHLVLRGFGDQPAI
jgi:hypothetical protein